MNSSSEYLPLITNVQVFFCLVAAIGIAGALSTTLIRFPRSHKVPLGFIGFGLVLTACGLHIRDIETIKIGHIIQNFGICCMVVFTIIHSFVKKQYAE